ncbi:MAG: site-specific DNA-methyltransferase [Microcystis aeruginosa L111-01]|jgi:hypothetical protein|nr:site-specific DNA-methyltransferase [Microcystis aeruginosa L111-01]NCS42184.1 site-specific DNA-methyltransferase [Microcystis aeruginosa BS11-05]NCS76380.1 site-specific DNA-methyltransferase [Microcystis aeruginosa K13-07]
MQLTNFISNKSDRSQAKKWLKTRTLACSYAGLSGKKSLWDLADLACKVETEWGNHPNYHFKALSDACGISESRLQLLARTAKFYPPKERFHQLSVSHHIEAMRKAPTEAHYWLNQALEKKWNSTDIRLAITGNGDPQKFSWLRCGTFWYFSHCDPRFGIKYPGRIPGQIAANLIHYFTEPDDLVVDLMAGGGSTLDAAQFLDRRCLAYDLASVRSDILINDALLGVPEEAHGAKLIFLDPPYGAIAKNLYSKHPHCLSQMNETEFINALVTIGDHCRQALSPDGYLSILIQNVYDWENHTIFKVVSSFLDNNWNLVSRIQAPISNQQISSSVMKWARENRKMVNTDRDLLVFQMNKLV